MYVSASLTASASWSVESLAGAAANGGAGGGAVGAGTAGAGAAATLRPDLGSLDAMLAAMEPARGAGGSSRRQLNRLLKTLDGVAAAGVAPADEGGPAEAGAGPFGGAEVTGATVGCTGGVGPIGAGGREGVGVGVDEIPPLPLPAARRAGPAQEAITCDE